MTDVQDVDPVIHVGGPLSKADFCVPVGSRYACTHGHLPGHVDGTISSTRYKVASLIWTKGGTCASSL